MNGIRIAARARHGAFCASALAILLAASGCGDGTGLPKRYPVSGTVKYKGAPVENGKISFIPDDPEGRTASGNIEKGSFYLTTLVESDGALPGKYKVTIESRVIDDTELKAVAKGGQFHHDKAFAKSVKTAKIMVPTKYSLPDTSMLTADVKPQSNSFPYDLSD
ncbi:hypothetical protein [Singulisphaera sp. PoT]|uniref:hypothetical protein n=1 Tax=Singulisphaera sp. PoT TaxID=3411797 RepID=UPI003BF47383